MDLSQYAELFLAESREHLSACNQLLLEWERSPANLAPVGGLFRAVHTVKGMAATMGYARVTDLAHRAEKDRKSTRLNSSHSSISYAVFCLKKKKTKKSNKSIN